jgi:hypothetical protein
MYTHVRVHCKIHYWRAAVFNYPWASPVIAHNCLGICVCHSSETLQANSPNFLCFQSGPSSAMQNRENCSSCNLFSAIMSMVAKPLLKCVQYVRLCTYTVQCTYENSAVGRYRYRTLPKYQLPYYLDGSKWQNYRMETISCWTSAKEGMGITPPPPRVGKWNKTRT